MGLSIVADASIALPSVTTVRSPDSVNEADARKFLLENHNIELSGGLGPLAGKVWRIGMMGHNSTANNVLMVLSALEEALASQGFEINSGSGVAAAQRSLRNID